MDINCGNCNESIFTRDNRVWCPVQGEWITAKAIADGKVCDWHSEIQRIVKKGEANGLEMQRLHQRLSDKAHEP